MTTSCATPGKDGPITLDASSTPNTYYPGISVSTTNGISTVRVGAAFPVGTTAITAGDLVLIMQMQGATIDTTPNSNNYGTVSNSTAGDYEYATVTSVTGSAPNLIITLSKALGNTYATSVANNLGAITQNFQLVRVPQYSSLTVSGVVSGAAWNSLTKIGGVLALDVAGVTTFSGTTPGLMMNAKGFGGGGGNSYSGPGGTNTPPAYATFTTIPAHGAKGEGSAGTPRYFYNGNTVVTTGTEGYASGDNNIGAPANAGGGAQDFTPLTNTGNSGGGGGGNSAPGGQGGSGFGSGGTGNLAIGGNGISTLSQNKLIMGGGGGAGSTNKPATATTSSGGSGGGIIILRTSTVSGTALVQADGADAASGSGVDANNVYLRGTTNAGAGGGGAGGTIMLLATPTPTTSSTGLAGITARASGGGGGNANAVQGGTTYGTGGGGSGGVVFASDALSTNTSVNAGAAGFTSNGRNGNNFATNNNNALAGTAGTFTTTTIPSSTNTLGGAGSCLPMLSVDLSTATPNVTRTNGTPNPARFTAIVSNTGGTAQSSSTTITMDPLFTYDNTFTPIVTLTFANGTSTTLPASSYTVSGTTTPVFNGIDIPSGATLNITFRATIAAAAVNGTAYPASSSATYLDPTRTASPTANRPSGMTSPASTTTVTVVVPLPVELTRFELLAIRQDALLSWTTASEKNNDHFTIERSLTGRNFTPVGTVRGQGTSMHATDYLFTDSGAGRLAAKTVYYRLQQVDTDGTPTYSPVRTVSFTSALRPMATIYPNPSHNQVTVDLSSLRTDTYRVSVLDLAGRVLRSQQMGALTAPLNVEGLPQGAYIVQVQGVGFNQTMPLIRN